MSSFDRAFLETLNSEFLGQRIPERLRDIGHCCEISRIFLPYPLEDLLCAICVLSKSGHELTQRFQSESLDISSAHCNIIEDRTQQIKILSARTVHQRKIYKAVAMLQCTCYSMHERDVILTNNAFCL